MTTISPPLRKAKGDASATSRGMPVIHRSTPATSFPQAHVIPADAGIQRKAKHAISTQTTNTPFTATPLPQQRVPPPLRSAKGDASAASRGMPVIHRSTPPRHSRGRGNPEKSKARHFHPNHQSPPFTPTPHPKNRIISLFPNLYPNSKQSPVPAHIWYFPTVLPTFT